MGRSFLLIICFGLFSSIVSAQEVAESPDKGKTLNCVLKAKAVQTGSFWGGTYFDTSITSEKIAALEINPSIEDLRSGHHEKASAKIKIGDQSIIVANDTDENSVAINYEIFMASKSRSISSNQTSIQLKSNIRFGKQVFEKEFSMISGHKAYLHFDVGSPSNFDLNITNIFMICSIK